MSSQASAEPLRVYSRSGRASARSNKLAIVLPIDAIFAPPLRPTPALRPRPANPHRSRPLEPFLPAVSSLGGFRTPVPRLHRRNGPASKTLHHSGSCDHQGGRDGSASPRSIRSMLARLTSRKGGPSQFGNNDAST